MRSNRLRTGISVTDQFCGAGGSSLGAHKAGIDVRLALNHWKLAIQTHNTNFPNTDHDCTDISASDPRRYPSTDILITSPECKTHSPAGGSSKSKPSPQTTLFKDDAETRSRATMWDVPRYAEYHDYNIIITENVVEAATQWVLFPEWLAAMERLGYCHRIVSMNSMHYHPTPQSRDRIYIVFWKAGNPEPLLDHTPPAPCPKCDATVNAVQSWKNGRTVGKYRTQYVFRCPKCQTEVTPYYYAAINVLDFGLPATRIGDRKTPLKERTMARVRWGLERYGRTPLVVRTNMTSGVGCRVRNATIAPLDTQPASNITAMVSPFVVETLFNHSGDDRAYPVDTPFGTQSTRRSKAVALPPMIQIPMRKHSRSMQVDGPLWTVSAQGNQHGLVSPSFLTSMYSDPAKGTKYGRAAAPITEPQQTVTTKMKMGLVVAPTVDAANRLALVGSGEAVKAEDCYFRMLAPCEIKAAMAFPKDYVVLGNKRQQVKQCGNAVTPPAMEFLINRCVESLR